MKRIFAVLIIVFTLLAVCSCETEEKKYKQIYGSPSKDTTNVVRAKCIDFDGTGHIEFELLDNIKGAGVEQKFDAYVLIRGDSEYQSVLYPSGTPSYSTFTPNFCRGETYILYLTRIKDTYRINCVCLDT